MNAVLPLSPRAVESAPYHAEHSPYPEIRETARRLVWDHEVAVASGRAIARAVPRPGPRTSRPSPLAARLTGILAGSLALIGALFLGSVLFAHVSARTAITVDQAVEMRGM